MTRSERIRANRTRRGRAQAITLAGAALVALLSTVVAVSVVTFHLGIRPVLTGSMRPDFGPGAVVLTRQIVLALLGGVAAAWAGTRWVLSTSSRPASAARSSSRRVVAGAT